MPEREAVVWEWLYETEATPTGWVEADGWRFKSRLQAVSEGWCPLCLMLNSGDGARLKPFPYIEPLAPEGRDRNLVTWSRCGASCLWRITYEDVSEVLKRWIYVEPSFLDNHA